MEGLCVHIFLRKEKFPILQVGSIDFFGNDCLGITLYNVYCYIILKILKEYYHSKPLIRETKNRILLLFTASILRDTLECKYHISCKLCKNMYGTFKFYFKKTNNKLKY